MVAPPGTDVDASRAVSLSSDRRSPGSPTLSTTAGRPGGPSTSSPNSVVRTSVRSRVFMTASSNPSSNPALVRQVLLSELGLEVSLFPADDAIAKDRGHDDEQHQRPH